MTHVAERLLPTPLPAKGDTEVVPGAAEAVQRYYQIAGMTVGVSADVEITDTTFAEKFLQFEVSAPVGEVIRIHHHFELPDLEAVELGITVRDRAPWVVYRQDNGWLYVMVDDDSAGRHIRRVAFFSADHTSGRIYSGRDLEDTFGRGGFIALTLLVTDQVVLAPILADRRACYVHSSGAILRGKGLLFVGHSEAGKSTAAGLLGEDVELLCDDRNIVRRWPDGFRVHGTWSHGELPIVSPSSAPLAATVFLRQAPHNRLERLEDRQRIAAELLPCVIKPLATAEWWGKTLDLFEILVREVPCYVLEFDRSGAMNRLLDGLVDGR